MASKLETDAVEPQSGTTLTLGAAGDTVDLSTATVTLPAVSVTAGNLASSLDLSGKTVTLPAASVTAHATTTQWQAVQTSSFTAVAGKGYPVNTTSGEITVTLPASASVGDTIEIVDYAGTFDTNKVHLDRNGLNIEGATASKTLLTDRLGIRLVYMDATQGWVAAASTNESGNSSSSYGRALMPSIWNVEFLLVAGGGSGGGSLGGGGGAGGMKTSYLTAGGGGSSPTDSAALSFVSGVTYTMTPGAGGVAVAGNDTNGNLGVASTIIGGLVSESCTGGGYGASYDHHAVGGNGGCGGGGGTCETSGHTHAGGTGVADQGFGGGTSPGPAGNYPSGGGGGAAAVGGSPAGASSAGGDGGAGKQSNIDDNNYYWAGGGGANGYTTATAGDGGIGGGGGGSAEANVSASSGGGSALNAGGNGVVANSGAAGSGGANTGGGGGGGGYSPSGACSSGAGGSGVAVLRMSAAAYAAGSTTGSPTVTTVGGDKVLTYTGIGTFVTG